MSLLYVLARLCRMVRFEEVNVRWRSSQGSGRRKFASVDFGGSSLGGRCTTKVKPPRHPQHRQINGSVDCKLIASGMV